MVGVSRGKGQREIKARATRWTRKKIFSRAPIGVRGCYTFHGPLSLRGWAIGKVKGEDRRKIHTRNNSREKKIHTAGTGRKTYIQAKKKKKHAHQANQNIIYTITRGVELTSLHLFLLFPNCPFLRRNLLLTTDGFVDTSAI